MPVSHQTWIIGNTLSDLLIASAMLYYVSSFRHLSTGSLKAYCSTPVAQLRKIWAKDGNLSSHVLVSIVRLTVETNLVTSKFLRVLDTIMCPSSYTRLATVSVAAMLMVAVYPVSGSMCHVRLSAKIDASNTGEELVCVPVCILFYLHKFLSCLSSD